MADQLYAADEDVDDWVVDFSNQLSQTDGSLGSPLASPKSYTQERGNTYWLYVNNFPKGFQKSGVKELFSKFGKVESCFLHVKGFAFVEFSSYTAAETAMAELSGTYPFFLNVRWKNDTTKQKDDEAEAQKKEDEEKAQKEEDEEKAQKEEPIITKQEAETARGKTWLCLLRIALDRKEAPTPRDLVWERKRNDENTTSPLKSEEKVTSPTVKLPLGRSMELTSPSNSLPPLGRSKRLHSAATGIGRRPPSTTSGNSNSASPDKQEHVSTTKSFTALISHVSYPNIYIILKQDMRKLLELKHELRQFCSQSTERLHLPKANEFVVAKFKEDQQWYRCRTEKPDNSNGTYQLYFIDFGNYQTTHISDIRKIKTELDVDVKPPFARKCRLYSMAQASVREDCKGLLKDLVNAEVRVMLVKEDRDVWLVRIAFEGTDLNQIFMEDVESPSIS